MEDPIHASALGPALGPALVDSDPDLDANAAIVHIPDELSETNSHDETGSIYGGATGAGFYDGYNSSASSTEHSHSNSNSSASGVLEHYFEDDDDAQNPNRNSRTSSHSSVSSIPSVLVRPQSGTKALPSGREDSGFWATAKSRRAFRKPSSVRAIQMHTEDESDGDGDEDGESTPSRRHRRGPSTRSSPLKSQKSKSQKSHRVNEVNEVNEYPLVLLHCTLLPPSLPVAGAFATNANVDIVKDVLPKKYYRRWKLLEEKVGSGYLRDRGVLISHPEDSYDLLEEKLLESLELQRPRLHHGHFLAHESKDDDKDQDDEDQDDDDEEEGDMCPDCGGRVVTCTSQNRKWEVKVFAANGMMRAGAWAAAWREMEKVDVEVSLWLPTDVRRELERRLLDASRSQSQSQSRTDDTSSSTTIPQSQATKPQSQADAPKSTVPASPKDTQAKQEQIALQTLLINYMRVLANDKRNIVIALLSITIAVFAMGVGRPSSVSAEVQVQPVPVPEMHVSPSASMSQYAAASARPSDSFASTIAHVTAEDTEFASASASSEGDGSNADVSELSDVPEPVADNLSMPDASESEVPVLEPEVHDPELESEVDVPEFVPELVPGTEAPETMVPETMAPETDQDVEGFLDTNPDLEHTSEPGELEEPMPEIEVPGVEIPETEMPEPVLEQQADLPEEPVPGPELQDE